ncbi:Pycsar system effector family protein [Costertonia aggregata]|uniref:Phosphohydrolase n=1 Tax=Costertonia aggregata TaxID=343403 RepID=A0A7H9ASZ4_9FLAO|nr:Pycsar system effector family protein [Costertonia aggregata]QLG46569.1 phosphohydrolase [Costertonia aggregata]
MKNLVEKSKNHIAELLSEQLGKNYLFHTFSQSKKIATRVEEILNSYEPKNLDHTDVLVAVWFLNAGFSKGYEKHVASSCELAEDFLSKINADKSTINAVTDLIKAAWSDEEPSNESEAIVKDGRTSFFASDDFEELMELLRMEKQNLNQNPPPLQEWRNEYIETFRTKHRFYTDYAKENWQPQKEENLISLIGAASKAVKKRNKEKLKVKLKNQSPERAIQSLYRTQLRNHLKLSDIADTKANILLSVNAIIISLLLANLIPKLGTPNNSYLIYPTVIFVLFSIASMIMSVMATRPKIENKNVVDGEISKKDTNYLFFGNFHAMQPQQFKEKMREIIQSKETIYDSLSMDLYFLGKVLKTKYQLLR